MYLLLQIFPQYNIIYYYVEQTGKAELCAKEICLTDGGVTVNRDTYWYMSWRVCYEDKPYARIPAACRKQKLYEDC